MLKSFIWACVSLILLILVGIVTPFGYLLDIISHVLIMGLYAFSLNIILGYTGMISFGHAAFFGVGAYTVGILLQKTAISFPVIFIIVIVASAVAAFVIGFFSVRLGEIYFAMITMAFSQLLYTIVVKSVSLTGGDQGLIGGIPEPKVNLGFFSFELGGLKTLYFFVVFLVILCLFISKIILDSPLGETLKAIRENPERARFIGINVPLFQLVAFIIAGIFAGISGMLMAFYIDGVYPDFLHWSKSAEPILMVLIGGTDTFLGPIFGAMFFIIVTSILTTFTNLWGLVLGAIIILFISFLRIGIVDFISTSGFVKNIFRRSLLPFQDKA